MLRGATFVQFCRRCQIHAADLENTAAASQSRSANVRRRYANCVGYELDTVALRSLRASKRLTQQQLSELIGVAEGRVSTWERGQSTPHPHQFRALAAALGVSIGSLLRPVDTHQRDLCRLRIEAGLSVKELAERVGVPVQTLKRWENGRVRNLQDRAPVREIAHALAVEVKLVREALARSSRR